MKIVENLVPSHADRKSIGRLMAILLLLLLIGGFGITYRLCRTCNVQGAGEVTWYGLHLWFVEGDDTYEYDEFGTMRLWEDINAVKCNHQWHFRGTIAFLIPYESGIPYRNHFGSNRALLGIRALAMVDKSLAKHAWDRLGKWDVGYNRALNALDHLGILESNAGRMINGAWHSLGVQEVMRWWDEHQNLFESVDSH